MEVGFRNGGRFGSGRKGGQQGGDQAATNNTSSEGDDDEAEDISTSPSSTADPAPLVAPASADVQASVALPEVTTTLVAASSTPTESFNQPTSVVDAFPEPQTTAATLVGIPYVVPSSSAIIESLSSMALPAPTSSLIPVSALTTTRLTITSSKTVYVTSAALPLPTSIPAEADSSGSAQATQAPSLDLAPLPASSVKPLSAGEKAGVGIGITFAVLIVVGAFAYELYRRRRMKARVRRGSETDSQDAGPPNRNLALRGFFGPNDKHDKKHDPEWSIESAEKISIVRAGSVRSVESQARPLTPPLPNLPSGPRFAPASSGTEVVKVGMAVPERKPTPKLVDMALRSNPPVSPSSFPSPPRPGKTGSWPLPE
ncbi:hypothetical protein SLS60_001024 [Paraconiothyrium brasiliense]|uniref:Uncharacterized protein n=1 Tax=Paraconiothyrium brasiliense TaxID=300254 RepID=A0ABR3S810_9PLEO